MCLHIRVFLTEYRVGDHHNTKTDHQSERGTALTAVRVGFGDNFVADNVQHRAARKRQCKREYKRSNADSEIP